MTASWSTGSPTPANLEPTATDVLVYNALACNAANTSQCGAPINIVSAYPTLLFSNIAVNPATGLVYFESTYPYVPIPEGGTPVQFFINTISIIDGVACRTSGNPACAGVGSVEVGDGPAGMSFDDTTNTAYVADTGWTYTDDNPANNPDYSDSVSIIPIQAPTQTLVTTSVANANPVVGQSISYTATVSAPDQSLFPAPPPLAGAVTFSIDGQPIGSACTGVDLAQDGTAICGPESYGAVANPMICATFTSAGDSPPSSATYLGSSSGCVRW